MEFIEFRSVMQKHVDNNMLKRADVLFVSSANKNTLWNLYLDSFPEGTNNIFRNRREYDCGCCKQYILAFGNIVAIIDNKIVSIWDFNIEDTTFKPVVAALSGYIHQHTVADVFITKEHKFGVESNTEYVLGKDSIIWNHFYTVLPKKFLCTSSKSVESIQGELRTTKKVLQRSLNEITDDAVNTVLDLISQNSLYKGAEWKTVLEEFLNLKNQYNRTDIVKDTFCWEASFKAGPVVSRLKNHSIGTLLIDISNGVDLDEAVRAYEKIVAPTNYKRPQAIFTKKMVEEAQKTVEELGFTKALKRRFAVLEDISINNVLFADRNIANKLADNVFEDLQNSAKDMSQNLKSFSGIEAIPIQDFIDKILPKVDSIEVYVENQHKQNLVSLIAPEIDGDKSMFKWDNNFSWAYTGNITDSMKELVKKFGGRVDGVLRFSIQWNTKGGNSCDYDAHCQTPDGNTIYFRTPVDYKTGGNLDVDIRDPRGSVAVENITFPDIKRLIPGKYSFFLHNFQERGNSDGFEAEIEFNGVLHHFYHQKYVANGEKIKIATVAYSDGKFSIDSEVPTNIWGIRTNQFIPVHVLMYSPNYWNGQRGIGNQHYFFMLKGCVNDSQPNGFFNEFLKEDLMKHRKVFEALGRKMKVAETNNQLSGLGFSSTQRNQLIVKVTGSFTRTLKITF